MIAPEIQGCVIPHLSRKSYGENGVGQSKSFLLTNVPAIPSSKIWSEFVGAHSPYTFVTVTRTCPTAIPKAGRNTLQDVVKINPWEKNKINDLTIKPLPEEVTKF